MKSASKPDGGWLQVTAILIFGVLMCLAPTSALPQTARFDISDATDLPGSDYKNFLIPNENLYTCVDACRNDGQCKAFTYVQGPAAHCWLKNAVPGKMPDNCCLSGMKLQPSIIIAQRKAWQQDGIDLPGGDYRSLLLDPPNAAACSATCANDLKCRAFTYVKPGIHGPAAHCWLKSSVSQEVKADGCCTSGIIASPPTDVGQVSLEPTTDRPGLDYKSMKLATADVRLCAKACSADPACKAYTYVAPGVQGPEARCYLKNGVPPAQPNACCTSGVKVPDSGQNTPLARGIAKHDPLDCKQSAVADIFDQICNVIPNIGCGGPGGGPPKQNCATHTRQIYIGSTFSAATQAEISKWNQLGGRGTLLGEAAMCALRELSPKATIGSGPALGGPIDVGYSSNIALGDISLKQRVGFVKFDPVALQFDGYRNMQFCAPVVGCYDSVAQDVRIKLDRVNVSPPLTAGAGGPKLGEHLILTVTTETSDKELVLKPPPIVVATPIGPVSVEPEFDYTSRESVIDSPYQNSNQTLRPVGDEPGWSRQGRVKDIYGIDYGVAFPYIYSTPWAISGWLSATALGNRDPSEKEAAWTVADQRPDRDLTVARTSSEKAASTEIIAKAKVTYPKDGNLGSLIPDWITNLGGDIKLSIFVEPRLRAAFSGQFDILAAEGVVPPGDIGAGGTWSGSDLAMLTGVGGAVGFKLNTGLDLEVSFPWPVGTVVDIHLHKPIDIFESPTYRIGNEAYFASRAGPWTATEPRTYTHFKTFKTSLLSGAAAAQAYPPVQACLASSKNVPEEPKPEPKASPGEVSKLTSPEIMEWPCNVCVFVKDKGSGWLFPATRPPGAKIWYCDMQAKSGCHEMCRFNPATNQLTFLRSPDKDLKLTDKITHKELTGEFCLYEPPG